MTTQLFEIDSQSKSQTTSSLAILFFLLGLPNVYGVLRRRSQRKAFLTQLLPLQKFGVLSVTLAGIVSCLVL
ncbi:MAG: hypothetical protein QNJ46_34605 [Leptolyngbyaceae cyanobacterium MO_188.B28]|nr:hypothetical protein [Leptolyngbyaceae cyanobacterium MO_188.B28]